MVVCDAKGGEIYPTPKYRVRKDAKCGKRKSADCSCNNTVAKMSSARKTKGVNFVAILWLQGQVPKDQSVRGKGEMQSKVLRLSPRWVCKVHAKRGP